MVEIIFTIDYEIYGNGEGSLKDHILTPTQQLIKIFDQTNDKIVFFIEAAELERIELVNTDPVILEIKNQIKELYQNNHEIALHLHPQWYNGEFRNGTWILDYSEYNLCLLTEKRIAEVVDRSIGYLRSVLCEPYFTPLSFRAGNWLFQPTQPAASILMHRGVKIDSSVFKGGLQYQHNLDYRPALQNNYFWRFQNDVNVSDRNGTIIEIPIFTEMVPPWRMATKKRLELQQKASNNKTLFISKIKRILDFARPTQPLKLDFCRMSTDELTGMMNKIIRDDAKTPDSYKPIVAIGHTKDLIDFDTVKDFLSYLHDNKIVITTFKEAHIKLLDS